MGLDLMHGAGTAFALITLLHDLLPDEHNRYLRDQLVRSAEWRLCLDEHYREGHDTKLFSDTGLVYWSWTDDPAWQLDSVRALFNIQARDILNLALADQDTSQLQILRTMWNYYNRSSEGVAHQDHTDPRVFSMVYNLSDTDGGTWIGDQFVQGSQGTAVIFPSHLWHRGQGPRSQPHRFVLNCIFSLGSAINNTNKETP